MTLTPTASSTSIANAVVTGDYDNFHRTSLGSAWSDAYDLYGASYFDQAQIVGDQLDATASHEEVAPSDGAPGNQLVGHTIIARDIGLSDDFEVGVLWDMTTRPVLGATKGNYITQVSPAAFLDLSASNALQMGVCPVYDVSLFGTGGFYFQNVFRQSPIGNVFDSSAYYSAIGSGALYTLPSQQGEHWFMMRVRSGYMRAYFDGVALFPSVAVPAWAVGRTYAGIHVIANAFKIGEVVGGYTVTEIGKSLVSKWWARPFTDTL